MYFLGLELIQSIADQDNSTVLHNALHQRYHKDTLQSILKHSVSIDAVDSKKRTALLLACIDEQIDSVKLLLKHGADPNIANWSDNSCLHQAVKQGHEQLVEVLLSHKVNIDAQNDHQETALFIACYKGYSDIVKLLIEKNAKMDPVNRLGNTPLHMAVKTNTLDIVINLLQNGACVNIKGQHEMTPLHVAINQGSEEALSLLLRHNPDVNAQEKNLETPLHKACKMGDESKAVILLQCGVHNTTCKNKEGCTAFNYTVRRCSVPVLEAFLIHHPGILNAPINSSETALHYYCRKGNTDMVTWFLHHGVDMDTVYGQQSPLDVALDNGHKHIVFMLTNAGANVSRSTKTCPPGFIDRIYQQRHLHMNFLEHLISSDKCKIDLAAVNEDHETLFFQACKDEAMDVVQMLLDSKHDIGINICNKFGKSPVFVLCESAAKPNSDAITVLSMLLQSGQPVDVDSPDVQLRTPLHIVSQHSSLMVANMLLRTSISSVNMRDIMHRTPLHYARTAEFVKLLVGFGADVNTCDVLGQTPLLFSCQQGNIEMVSALMRQQIEGINTCDHMGRNVVHLCAVSGILDVLPHVDDLPINMMDINKQSPLHIAALNQDPENTQKLLKMGADPNITDKNNLCPLHLAADSKCQEILLENKATSATRTVHGCVPENMKQWHCQLKARDRMELWHDIVQDGHRALQKIMHMPLVGFIEADEQYQKEYLYFQDQLKHFVGRLCEEVHKIDPLLECDFVSSGSVVEDTQVCLPDSIDFVCILPQLSDLSQTPRESTASKASLTLQLKPDLRRYWPCFVDCDGDVNAQVLLRHFGSVVQQALVVPEIWTDFPHLYLSPVDDLTKPNSEIREVKMFWHGSVYKWLPISVNIIPGLVFPGWWPSWCKDRSVIQDTQCCIVAQDPGNAQNEKESYLFQVNSFDAEVEMFRRMTPELRDGFKLAKLMRQPCICQPLIFNEKPVEPASVFISSYMLKTVAFYLHEEQLKCPEKFHVTDDSLPAIAYALQIYEKLSEALDKNFLGMYTVPAYNLLHDHFQKMRNPTKGREFAQIFCSKIRNLLDKSLNSGMK